MIEEYRRPMMSDDIETAQTVYLMDGLTFDDAAHRLVIDATMDALRDAGYTLNSTPLQKACAVFWWLKKHIRYVPTPGTNPLVDQTLIPPATLLSMPDPEGDCPQFSMLAAAMLRVCCVPSQFKTIAADADYPETFSHIYNVVQIGPGQFLPFDASNGPEPGAEFARPGKTKVWPAIAQDRCRDNMNRSAFIPSNRNRVLRGALRDGHLYQTLNGPPPAPLNTGKIIPGQWSPWRRRLGQDDGDLDTLPIESTFSSAPLEDSYNAANPLAVSAGSSIIMTGPPLTSDQLSTLQLSPSVPAGTAGTGVGLLASLAADATSLLQPVVKAATQQTPVYVTNPATGQSVLYNPNTGQVVGAASPLSSLGSGSLLLLLGLGAVLLLAGKK
jgi:Transglutaminase-like superfamily